jgi:hypothetical protein
LSSDASTLLLLLIIGYGCGGYIYSIASSASTSKVSPLNENEPWKFGLFFIGSIVVELNYCKKERRGERKKGKRREKEGKKREGEERGNERSCNFDYY